MNGDDLHVIFGTGPVGMAVMDALSRRGQRVRLINRSGKAHAPAGVEVLGGDATDPAFVREASAGAEVVYFALNPAYDRWPELFPALQAGVIAGAASAGAKLVAMENLYMYGPTGGKKLTEDLPHAAKTWKETVRARMTADLFAAHEAGKVRASDFFGPRVLQSAAGDGLFGPALSGETVAVAGDPDLPHTFSYAPDIGEGLAILGEREEALGRAWHLPGPETVTTRRFVEAVFEEAGHAPRIEVTPRTVLEQLAEQSPYVKELVEMLYEFEEPFVLDAGAFERTFGAGHATPLRDAGRETVHWYHERQRHGAEGDHPLRHADSTRRSRRCRGRRRGC